MMSFLSYGKASFPSSFNPDASEDLSFFVSASVRWLKIRPVRVFVRVFAKASGPYSAWCVSEDSAIVWTLGYKGIR